MALRGKRRSTRSTQETPGNFQQVMIKQQLKDKQSNSSRMDKVVSTNKKHNNINHDSSNYTMKSGGNGEAQLGVFIKSATIADDNIPTNLTNLRNITQEDNETRPECNKRATSNDLALQCEVCTYWYRPERHGVSESMYRALDYGG
ncbi:hypothetical protein LSH36_500g02049 [Paralvinella palmiformis]|uniref:Uncharacterized protein n=1 Tax=Paralvinella palmiformis TaxID=53620 RepID=A0AAD9J8S9_9ANNE|nr:hypothetical protein LSH36_500g02049 [Paralvinella palmiformis]